MSEYIPGVCNIGKEEIALRRKSGMIGLVISVLMFFFFSILSFAHIYRIIIFLPVFLTSIGFLQSYFHFCVGFGFSGIYNVLKPAGNTETIEQQSFRKKDRQKAIQITLLAIIISAGLVFILINLPF